MADRIFKLASVTFIVGEVEYDLAKFTTPELVMPAVAELEEYTRVFSVPVTVHTVMPDADYLNLLKLFVGESLPYRRRQTMLDLARYTRWPYTN